MFQLRKAGIAIFALLVVAACSDKNAGTSATTTETTTAVASTTTAAPPVITVHAKNYSFDLPDTITGGVVTIDLVSEGPAPEVHHIDIIRVLGNFTSKDLANEMKSGGFPAWAKSMGGPNVTTMPGATSSATMDLKPGNYIAVCFVPGPDLVPHAMKGMMKDFVVKAPDATAVAATMPTADIDMKLADYNFAITPDLTAGKHTIRVENTAAQDHEVVMVKLDAGKTPDDLIKFVETMKGPPPGTFVGGVSGLSNGAVNVFTVDLTPGDYALVCFIPDAKDGKPHAVHGMKQLVHVS